MPQFHSPDFVYLNGHASTSSMQPLMNGHLAADSADGIESGRGDGAAAPLAMTCRTPSEDRDPEENEVDSDPGLFLSFRKRGLWHDRSGLEKLLAGLVILCLIGFLTVVILLATGPRDNEARNALKSSSLIKGLVNMGYWPILHGNESEKVDITWLLGTSRKLYGNEAVFSMYVYADAKNTSQNMLYIDQGVLALGRGSRDYYLNETLFGAQMTAYRTFMGSIVKLLALDSGIKLDPEKLEKDLKEIVDFEIELAKITVPEAQRRNHTRMYNKHTISDVAKVFPFVNWTEYFDIILPEDVKPLIKMDTVVIMCEPGVFKKLTKLLKDTGNRILRNYILWLYTKGWAKVLDTRFDDIRQDFLKVMTGQDQKPPKWKECVPGPVTWLPLAAGSLYVRHHFDKKDKKEALEMIGNLRESFIDLVHNLDWMDKRTKETAVDKAKAMLNHIGYPDFIIDDAKLDKHYENLTLLSSDDYFELVRRVMAWSHEKEWRMLLKPFDKSEFEISPAIVNAFYSPEKNAITFPAGILQPPFFNGDYPKSINYGAMGAVIGHEITHGFDDQGSQFDKEGNLNNWWSKQAYDGFKNRTKCIIAQYSNYEVPETNGLKVNGILTQGENIADNGGVKEAFYAYRKYIRKHGSKEEPRLPGMTNFTNNQLFFLSYAHFWCGHKKPEAATQQILTDEHSPEIFRVIGVLSNLDAFSEAYTCKPNSKLNPPPTDHSKCIVW